MAFSYADFEYKLTEVLLDILYRLIALSHRDRMLRVLFVILWRWINRRVFSTSIIY